MEEKKRKILYFNIYKEERIVNEKKLQNKAEECKSTNDAVIFHQL